MATFTPRVAVVHDWLQDYAGSERVLADILRCYPDADLFALVDHMSEADRAAIGGRRARTTFLQRLPGAATHLRYYLPLMPLAIEQLDVTDYDLVISSNHAVAKGVIVSPDALHVSYVHSPMRYAWDQQFIYLREERLGGVRGMVLRALLHRLRLWDHRAAAGVDHFVANSGFVARRIRKTYRREADVIYPPIDTDFFVPGDSPRGERYVTASRLMGYKRCDVLVEAFRRLPGRRLLVIGDGPQRERLAALAPQNVEFAGNLPADALREQLQKARAFLFAAIEDFGMAPVEAMACGTPVIALGRGGCAETVLPPGAAEQPTGMFFDEQTPDAVAAAVRAYEASEKQFSPQACRRRAEEFSRARFRSEFSALVSAKWREWPC